MSLIFDTLEYTKGAELVGIKREHAEYQAKQISRLIDNELATKNDLFIALKDLENRLIIKLGAMMFVGFGLVITILSFLK
jgi:GDP-D-mannose dehydratase